MRIRRQSLARWIENAVYLLAIWTVTWLASIIYSLLMWALACALVLGLCGCAHFSSEQVETAHDGTKRATTIRVFTFFDAKSDLSKLRASTSDKVQGMTLAGLSESSSGTNLVHVLELIAAIAAATAK